MKLRAEKNKNKKIEGELSWQFPIMIRNNFIIWKTGNGGVAKISNTRL